MVPWVVGATASDAGVIGRFLPRQLTILVRYGCWDHQLATGSAAPSRDIGTRRYSAREYVSDTDTVRFVMAPGDRSRTIDLDR
jgi:hypothetical protein